MQSVIGFVKMLCFALLLSCAVSSLMMELHWMPKQAGGRTGVMINDKHAATTQKVEKGDVLYPDFWLVDGVPADGQGFTTAIDAKNGAGQVRYPMDF